MPSISRTLVVAFVAAAGTACHSPLGPASPHSDVVVDVGHYGELRRILHEQDTSSKIMLGELTPDPTLYAVGALSELRGEITVVAGRVFVSRAVTASTSETDVSTESAEQATLLVLAHVASWLEVPILETIAPESFDSRIKSLAAAAGVSTDDPFPFLIVGPTAALRWHVIDGRRLPPAPSSHADHLRAGVQHVCDRADVTLIGFFSERHQGVFTHRGSSTHVHCVLDSPPSAGHVIRVTVLPGAILFLPAGRNVASQPIAPGAWPPAAVFHSPGDFKERRITARSGSRSRECR